MLTNASNLGTKRDRKGQEFFCKNCNYVTSHVGHWKRHINTIKHKKQEMLVNASSTSKKGRETKFNCICGKSYLHNSSYYRHKQQCKMLNNNNNKHEKGY